MREEIIKMAREAGFKYGVTDPVIYAAHERFFHMAQAAEREAVLDLVDAYAKNNTDLAEAIRARGTPQQS